MKKNFITLGKFGATHGVRGWLRIHSYAEYPEDLFNYQPLYKQDSRGDWQKIKLIDYKPHGKGFIAKIQGYDTPEKAQALVNQLIGLPREQLEPLLQNEYYWSDLVGLTVYNNNERLGVISYLLETGSNDVIIVKDDHNKEYAIPYLLNDVIIKIDLENKELHCKWDIS